MSQSGFYLKNGGGGGGIVFTVEGNTGGKVGPDDTGNINIVGSGNITVAGDAGTFTETISFTGVLPIANGGTDTSSFSTVDGTVYYNGTSLATTSTGTAGEVLTSNGVGFAPTYQAVSSGGFSSINVQKFTTSGTYTPTAGMSYCTMEVIGGGGGGGGTAASTGNNSASSGGGGGGGYARLTASAATVGASQTVTVGAGGAGGGPGDFPGTTGATSSVGSLVSATGGTGGTGSAIAGGTVFVAGSTGGTGSSGDVNATGGTGGIGLSFDVSGVFAAFVSCPGGNSIFGGGGPGSTVSGNGANGLTYGGGGAGTFTANSDATAYAGGNGANGIVIVTEYIS